MQKIEDQSTFDVHARVAYTIFKDLLVKDGDKLLIPEFQLGSLVVPLLMLKDMQDHPETNGSGVMGIVNKHKSELPEARRASFAVDHGIIEYLVKRLLQSEITRQKKSKK